MLRQSGSRSLSFGLRIQSAIVGNGAEYDLQKWRTYARQEARNTHLISIGCLGWVLRL